MIDHVIGAIQRDISSAVYELVTRFVDRPEDLITAVRAKLEEWVRAGEISQYNIDRSNGGLIPTIRVRMTRNGTTYKLENGKWKHETS